MWVMLSGISEEPKQDGQIRWPHLICPSCLGSSDMPGAPLARLISSASMPLQWHIRGAQALQERHISWAAAELAGHAPVDCH